ncbi:MAG TPA: TadE/TadG family type IV pilus assembly protein, partial [Anaerolineales bacterium]|nr:TadE/TadG family type IV pilus assembly protein [Anaerolineales bacterium]
MKFKKFAPQKNAAQAIVEFAIVLPLLLLLLYGLLEAGRLLFIYSSVVNASRQAARYGSVTGQGSDFSAAGGPSNTGVSRYQDCAGIKWSAQRTDFLDAFEDDDIIIQYDGGQGATASFVGGGVDNQCTGDTDNTINPSNNNTDRITVTVNATYHAIVPKIVPFLTRTIEATSSRTILRSITIPVAGAGGGGGGGAKPDVTVTTSPNPSQVNEPVTLTATLSISAATGTVTFKNGGTTICTANVAGGAASCPGVTFSAIGNYTIDATY